MWIADKYIDYVREQTIENPGQSWGRMLLGFQANKLRTKLLPKKEISKGYQKLEALMMSFVADSLCRPDSYVWGNIFSPCEIMQCFGLSTLSIECLSCYLSGYRLEDYFIDYAQNTGIAPTLCSYHKTFVGAIDSGAVPAPWYAVTTSLSCDGNLNTFRYLEKKKGVPFTFLDVPYGDDEASVDYLAGQLRDFAGELERRFGKTFDEEKLKENIRIENETRKELMRFFRLQSEYYYPGELISHLYMMMGMHLLIGTQEFLDLVRFMIDEIQTYPKFEGKRSCGCIFSLSIRRACSTILIRTRNIRSSPAILSWTLWRRWTRRNRSMHWRARSSIMPITGLIHTERSWSAD